MAIEQITIEQSIIKIRNSHFEDGGNVFDFVTDDPPPHVMQQLSEAYDNDSTVNIALSTIFQPVRITMLLPFDNYKGMSYNIRMKAIE